MNYQEISEYWLNSKTLSEDEKNEIRKMDDKELEDAFYTYLSFGTGGMRGIMGIGTNRMNKYIIAKVTLGFARYLLKNEPNAKENGVVIAHDNRYNNDLFTNSAAMVLSSLGIKTYIFDSLRPTPELSFAIRYLKACGGINITASHNPKEYNGYKIYNHEGNQLILEQSNKVLEEVNKITNELDLEFNCNKELINVISKDVDEAYLNMVMSTSLNPKMRKDNITIIYSPEHGTGYIPVSSVLSKMGYNFKEVKEQCSPLPDFANTSSPNPEEKGAYELGLTYANKYNADLIVVNDPDCDRIGITLFDEKRNPVYMSGNQTGAILIDYILSNRKAQNTLPKNGIIFNTIVSSPLGAKIAKSYGVVTKQTLTGFKYIGDEIEKLNQSKEYEFIMGYEESYGYLINPCVRDKDGVQSAMLICEMASFYKHQGLTLLEKYEELQRKYGYHVESQTSFYATGKDGVAKINGIMDLLRNSNINTLANYHIKAKEDYLSLIKIENNQTSSLNYESSNVLRYILDDDSFVAIRPSGTEPKIKFYFAMSEKSAKEAKEKHDLIKDFILKLIEK